MRVHIVVTDGGKTFEGEAALVPADGARHSRSTPSRHPRASVRAKPDFSLPLRAFVNRHAKTLGGPQKFALLLARMSGGKTGVPVSVKEIEKAWNRMKGLMGKYNGAYTTRAKDKGWVDTTKPGHYALLSGWDAALGD